MAVKQTSKNALRLLNDMSVFYICHSIQLIWRLSLYAIRPICLVPLHLSVLLISLSFGFCCILPYHLLSSYTRLPVRKTLHFFLTLDNHHSDQFCIVALYDSQIRRLFQQLTKEWQNFTFAIGEICLEMVYFGIVYVLGIPIILQYCTPVIEKVLTKFCTPNGYYNKQHKTPYSLVNVVAPDFTIDNNAEFFPALKTPRTIEYFTSTNNDEKLMSSHESLFSIWSNRNLIIFQAYVLSMCSKLAYEDTELIEDVVDSWTGFNLAGVFKSPEAENSSEKPLMFTNMVPQTYSFVSTTNEAIIITFRGTTPLNLINWVTDLSGELVFVEGIGNIHAGFYRALTYSSGIDKPSVYSQLVDKIKFLQDLSSSKKAIFITGHSLGAALASVFTALCFRYEEELSQCINGLYTFGQPRSGDLEYCSSITKNAEKYSCKIYRFVHSTDIMTRLPTRNFSYVHHGQEVYLDGLNGIHTVNDQIQGISSNEFVFRLLLSAYKVTSSQLRHESWLRLCSRFIFFFVPGISDHFPSDYTLILHENVGFPSGIDSTKAIVA